MLVSDFEQSTIVVVLFEVGKLTHSLGLDRIFLFALSLQSHLTKGLAARKYGDPLVVLASNILIFVRAHRKVVVIKGADTSKRRHPLGQFKTFLALSCV